MMVDGVLAVLFWGFIGGAVAEILKIIEYVRAQEPPETREWFISAATAALGCLAIVWGFNTPKPALELMVQGAAFPLIFSRSVAAARSGLDKSSNLQGQPPLASSTNVDAERRSLLDYIAGRS